MKLLSAFSRTTVLAVWQTFLVLNALNLPTASADESSKDSKPAHDIDWARVLRGNSEDKETKNSEFSEQEKSDSKPESKPETHSESSPKTDSENNAEPASSKQITAADAAQNGKYKCGEGLFAVDFRKAPKRERAQLSQLGKMAVVLFAEQSGFKSTIAFVAVDQKLDLSKLQADFASLAAGGLEAREYKEADVTFKSLPARQFEFVSKANGDEAVETKALIFKSESKAYLIAVSGQRGKMVSPAVLEFINSFNLDKNESAAATSKFSWSSKTRSLANLPKAEPPKHTGGYLPHFDYVPEFPYPAQIMKTGKDDVYHSRTVQFTTALTPMQLKTFYEHFLQENSWGTDVWRDTPASHGCLVLQPPPTQTRDGRMIIRIGPTGGCDYELKLKYTAIPSGSLVDLEYIDHNYHGRPKTAASAQKYFMPNIKSK